MNRRSVDKTLLFLVYLLVGLGFLIFSSASLGLLARGGASFSSVATSQFFFGIIGGSVALFLFSNIHYRNLRKYSFYIFLFTLLLSLAVFIPGLGASYGGATRWLSIAGFSLQPAELLKIGFIIYAAAWLSGRQKYTTSFMHGVLPYVGLLGLVAAVLLLQPDTDTFLLIAAAGMAMFFTAGARWRDIIILCVAGVLALSLIALARPYVMERITTFLNPTTDQLGSSYQIQQSLIAVGSGGLTGRGFGQSIQKFEYLPEPIGDSIFAVFAEEFGFVGGVILILLYALFTFRGFKIATTAQDMFGMLLVVGCMTLIVMQAFLNIGSMLGVAPLSGLPLPFISHGGTALLATLAMIGIVLNVSRYQKSRR